MTSSVRSWLLGWHFVFHVCFPAVGSIGGILKSECKHFLGDAMSSVSRGGVCCTSGQAGVLLQ